MHYQLTCTIKAAIKKRSSMTMKILLRCVAISFLIRQNSTFCSAAKPSSLSIELPDSTTTDFQNSQPVSPFHDLAHIINQDALDGLWAQNLAQYTHKQAEKMGITKGSQSNNTSPKNLPVVAHYYKKDLHVINPKYKPTYYKTIDAELEFPHSSNKPILLQGHTTDVVTDSCHPTKKIIATGDMSDSVILWNCWTGKKLAKLDSLDSLYPENSEDQAPPTPMNIFFNNPGTVIITTTYPFNQNPITTYWTGPFGSLNFEQAVLLSLIIKEFNEAKSADFCKLAHKYNKPVELLQETFATLPLNEKKIIKKNYKLKNEGNKSSTCIIS